MRARHRERPRWMMPLYSGAFTLACILAGRARSLGRTWEIAHHFGRLADRSVLLIFGAAQPNVRQVKMSSRVEVYRAKAEMCRVQAALRGDTPVGRRWLKLSQQWSGMAESAKEAP